MPAPRLADRAPLLDRPGVRATAAVAWAGLVVAVTWLALLPGEQAPPGSGWDKLDHVAAFAALAALGLLAAGRRRGILLAVATVLLLHGAAIEWLQQSVPGRSGEVQDWLADALGVLLGAAALAWARRPRH